MKRTIAGARQALEEALPTLSDFMANEGRKTLAEAETKAKEHADQFLNAKEQEALALRDHALRELTAMRDEYDALTSEGAKGRMPARDYSARLMGLRARQQEAERQLARAEELTQQIADIEADAIAWFDQLTLRMHQLRDFPW